MRCIGAAAIIAVLLTPMAAFAQEPPIPRPRPDFLGTAAESGPDADSSDELNDADAQARLSLQTDQAGAPPAVSQGPAQPVTLSARVTEEGTIIPAGLVWRIFGTRTDETGQLAMLAKSEDATAAVSLPPGEYLIHVAYGRSQASDTLIVELGPNTKTIVLDAGALRLNSMVTGDIPIAAGNVMFDIYTATGGADERVLVAQNIRPLDIIHLNAGVYNVVSRFGEVNAVIRADLRVEPGQMTEATLYHRAAQVDFTLVSEAGGEAIADVEWTVTDDSGSTIFSDLGAFPSTVLAEGEYTVLANAGGRVFNRDFEVQPGQPREIEILTTVY